MSNRYIEVKDKTKLFNKDFLIYSLFDVSFPKPVKISFFGYFIIIFLFISVPLFIVFPFNSFLTILEIGIPFLLSSYLVQPIWNEKKFPDWLKTQLKYLSTPKRYYDLNAIKDLGTYEINSEFVVSRHRDYELLAKMESENNVN